MSNNSRHNREIRDEVTLVFIPMLNPDGATGYQRENDQTWAETQARFPQLLGRAPAFYRDTPGPRFWGDPRVEGFDLNRDFNPDFGYVPAGRAPAGQRRRRAACTSRASRAPRRACTPRSSRSSAPSTCSSTCITRPRATRSTTTATRPPPDRYTPMSISAQFLRDPAAHGAGTTYPKFDYDASRRANVAAWLGTQGAGSPAADVTRYPQNLDLAGSANSSYQLRGSASVLMEAGRQRHANPEWRLDFIAGVHEMAVRGSSTPGRRTFDTIDPNRYEQIPVRQAEPEPARVLRATRAGTSR